MRNLTPIFLKCLLFFLLVLLFYFYFSMALSLKKENQNKNYTSVQKLDIPATVLKLLMFSTVHLFILISFFSLGL